VSLGRKDGVGKGRRRKKEKEKEEGKGRRKKKEEERGRKRQVTCLSSLVRVPWATFEASLFSPLITQFKNSMAF
jgi:hypothetical protein